MAKRTLLEEALKSQNDNAKNTNALVSSKAVSVNLVILYVRPHQTNYYPSDFLGKMWTVRQFIYLLVFNKMKQLLLTESVQKVTIAKFVASKSIEQDLLLWPYRLFDPSPNSNHPFNDCYWFIKDGNTVNYANRALLCCWIFQSETQVIKIGVYKALS